LIVDAHLHVWNAESPSTPWRQGWARHAHGPSFTAGDALREMEAAGVDRAALLPTAWDVNGNELVLACAARYPDRFVAFVTPDLRKPHDLGAWRDDGAAGFRVMFPPGVRSWLDDGTADWFWPAVAATGLPVAVWAPGQSGTLARVARGQPGLRLVIDHLNLGMESFSSSSLAQVDELAEMASLDNVAVKASALPCDDAAACSVLSRAAGMFGPARVFWGSDLGRLACSYARAVQVVARSAWTSRREDRELVLGNGFEKWLNG
jgi:L-fuconolactonase